MSAKKQLLDPLGTVCKLVALNFTEINTKISIQDHILTLHKPNSYQFLVRFYNGDGRENISELYDVIIRIIRWYLVPRKSIKSVIQTKDDVKDKNDEGDDEDEDYDSDDCDIAETYNADQESDSETDAPNADEICQSKEIKQLVIYLCDAFRKLQQTYNTGNVVLSLQFFINILEDALEGKYDESRLPKHVREKEDTYKTLLDYNKIKNMWELKDVQRIIELYENCFKLYFNDTETPQNTKIALIQSYLKSVDSVLEIADKEFQRLIQNSNNG